MSRRILTVLAVTILLVPAMPTSAGSDVSSTFDTDQEYWQWFYNFQTNCSLSNNLATHTNTGGNPGGFISGTDIGGEPPDFMRFLSPCHASSPWTDNHAEHTGGTFSFDLRASGTPVRGPYPQLVTHDTDVLAPAGGDFLTAPTANTWTNYSLTLSAASGDFAYCPSGEECHPATQKDIIYALTNFSRVYLVADTGAGDGEVVDIDNPSFSGGTMPADGDGDGVANVIDDCPTKVGWGGSEGCPQKRSLSLTYKRATHLFKGGLIVDGDGLHPCANDRKVKIFKKVRGPDKKIGQATTTIDTGKYQLFKQNVKGKYYSKIAFELIKGFGGCAGAKSPTITRN